MISGRACAKMHVIALQWSFWARLRKNARICVQFATLDAPAQNAQVRASPAIDCAESRCIAFRRACARECEVALHLRF
eukprot:4136260-Pyramimonas_sp.AAC.1